MKRPHYRQQAKEEEARYQSSVTEKDRLWVLDPDRKGTLGKRLRERRRLNRGIVAALNAEPRDRKFRLVTVKDEIDKKRFQKIPNPYPKIHEKQPYQIKDSSLWILLDKRTLKAVAIIRQTPFSSMMASKLSDLKTISDYLLKEREYCNPVETNGAMRKGYMGAIGYRKSYDAGEIAGSYRPLPEVQKSREKIDAWWKECVLQRPKIEQLYCDYYKSLSGSCYQETVQHLNDLNMPSFSQINHTKRRRRHCVGGNLTFTMDAFHNIPHVDNDSPGWSYGLFFSIHKETGDLAYNHQGCDILGGQFWWPDFDCEVDFSLCDGLTEILWRGGKDFHCTRPCEEPSGKFTRLGTSVQVGLKYANACLSLTRSWKRYTNPVPTASAMKRYKALRDANISQSEDKKTTSKSAKKKTSPKTKRYVPRYVGSPAFLREMYLKNIKEKEEEKKKKALEKKKKVLEKK